MATAIIAGTLVPAGAVDCAAIKDGKDRLACYDKATAGGSSYCTSLKKLVGEVSVEFGGIKGVPDDFPELGGYKVFKAKKLFATAKECTVWIDDRPGKMPGHAICSWAVKVADRASLLKATNDAFDEAKGCFADAQLTIVEKTTFEMNDVSISFDASFEKRRASSYNLTVGRKPTDEEFMNRARATQK